MRIVTTTTDLHQMQQIGLYEQIRGVFVFLDVGSRNTPLTPWVFPFVCLFDCLALSVLLQQVDFP